jgi:2-polyprenyl-3-methyl-5-hydroxy-6-metoxy-1,4-benzoquinol methylase
MPTEYRKIIYSKYHTTQSGRDKDIEILLHKQADFFSKEILPFFPDSKKCSILDIGAGNGSFLLACKQNGYTNCIGLDLSPEQVKIGQSFGINELLEADALNWMKQNPGKYDVVTAFDLVEHLTKDELMEMISAIVNSLKPGGIFIFRTPNLDCPLPNPYARGDFSHETFLNKHSATQLLYANGFNSVSISEGLIQTNSPFKEMVRKSFMGIYRICFKIKLFTLGYVSSDILITPNLIAVAKK